MIAAYTEGVQTVDPKQAVGKLNELWVNFAKFYEAAGQLDDSRIIFEKGTQVPYLKVDDLSHVWCQWAEMELRHKCVFNFMFTLYLSLILIRFRLFADANIFCLHICIVNLKKPYV